MRGILTGYVFRELARPLLAWTAALLCIFWVMLFLRGTEFFLGSGAGLGDLALASVYFAPQFLFQVLPIAFLIAVLQALGRLRDDRELLALGALGASPAQLLVPLLAWALLLTGAQCTNDFVLRPWAVQGMRRLGLELVRRNLVSDVKPGQFYEGIPGLMFYVEQVGPDGAWTHVLALDERDAENPALLRASGGRARSTAEGIAMSLTRGDVQTARPAEDTFVFARFDDAALQVNLEAAFVRVNLLGAAIDALPPTGLATLARAAASEEEQRGLWAQLHWRIAQQLLPFVYALVALALGLGAGLGGRGVLLGLATWIAYYVLARIALGLGERGGLPPFVAGHLANGVFVALGLILFARRLRAGAKHP